MSEDNKKTEAEIVSALTLLTSGHSIVGNHPYKVLGESQEVESLENLLPAPLRIQSTPEFLSTQSLVDYIEKFKTPATVVFAGAVNSLYMIKAEIDYHDNGAPSWCSHTAEYRAKFSPEFQKWLTGDKVWSKQELFANFIEDNILDVAVPTGAELLEIASSLEAKKNVDFKSAVRLADGTNEFLFSDTLQTKVAVPAKFILGISPFENSPKYQVSARLRYRTSEGRLMFCYILERPEKIIQAAFDSMVDEVKAKTGVQVFLGSK